MVEGAGMAISKKPPCTELRTMTHAPLRWLTGNIGIHHVHHLSSKVPHYICPKSFETIQRRFSCWQKAVQPCNT